jgi:cbb3-type cytochrome oxidase subunit 3
VTIPPQPELGKAGPTSVVLTIILLIMISVPIAICWIFFFGRIYGTIALVGYFLLMPVVVWFFRRHKRTEADMIRRIDQAMGKPSDDPREMARFLR